MTAEEFRAIRERAGLTQAALAARLRLNTARAIRQMEAGDRSVSGPVSLLMELIDRGVLPDQAKDQ